MDDSKIDEVSKYLQQRAIISNPPTTHSINDDCKTSLTITNKLDSPYYSSNCEPRLKAKDRQP